MSLLATFPATPLFADAEDLITIVIVIVFFLISAVGQLLSKMRAKGQPEGDRARPQRPPRPANQAPQARKPVQAGQPEAAGDIHDEIADFLRRATQQGRAAEPARKPKRPVPVQAAAEELPIDVEVIEEAPLGSRLKEHVGEYLDEGRLARQSSRLGEQVGHADERLGERLHEVFDHDVGSLTHKPGETAKPTSREEGEPVPVAQITAAQVGPVAAIGVASLLSNTENLRQAIIINEILQRPVDRWA